MLTKTTLEVVDQFNSITTDLDNIGRHLERQKNRQEEGSLMADVLDEKLGMLISEAPPQEPRRWQPPPDP